MVRKTVPLNVDIPVSLYRKLEESAAAQGRSVGEFILACIRSSLVDGKPPRAKKVHFPLILSKGQKVEPTNEQIYERVEFP
jgi:hypothetical protein